MAKASIRTVDAYIAAQPSQVQGVLQRVRASIRRAAGSLTEEISYQMPTYTLQGTAVIYFAAWKNHYALYPLTKTMHARFAAELQSYVIEKSTVRLTYDQPPPVRLIQAITKQRVAEVREKLRTSKIRKR